MARNRRQIAVLALLVAVLAAVVVWQLWPARAASSSSATARPSAGPNAGARNQDPAGEPPPEVRLFALERAGPEPVRSGRNPFRFTAGGASTPLVTPPPVTAQPPQGGEAEPSGLPSVPPIPYKFIGIVTSERSAGRIAVLSDGKFVYYGREGDIIEGRYRLVRIGEESLQIEHLDGRGRQTLRMSGS